jgi:hypothetical protein
MSSTALLLLGGAAVAYAMTRKPKKEKKKLSTSKLPRDPGAGGDSVPEEEPVDDGFNAFDELHFYEDYVTTKFDPSFDSSSVYYSGTNAWSSDQWDNGPFPVHVYKVAGMNYTDYDGVQWPYVLLWSTKKGPSERSKGALPLRNFDHLDEQLRDIDSGEGPRSAF